MVLKDTFTPAVLLKLVITAAPFVLNQASAQEMHHHHHHTQDDTGLVMNENRDRLPNGCDAISEDQEFTIQAGREFADAQGSTVFGMSEHVLEVQPCSRLTIHFENRDDIRHQWMVHGLPHYLYPGGMFHIEAFGGQTQSGTFIVPPEDETYLIHCDMAQHMEMGMKGQLVVGSGSGNLWSIPGVTASFRNDEPPLNRWYLLIGAGLIFALAARQASGRRKPLPGNTQQG